MRLDLRRTRSTGYTNRPRYPGQGLTRGSEGREGGPAAHRPAGAQPAHRRRSVPRHHRLGEHPPRLRHRHRQTVDQLDGRGPDGLIGHSRALDSVTDTEVGAALETLWGDAAVNTWNARRAAVGKWLSWCAEQGWTAPRVPTSAARSTPPDSDTPVRSRTAIDRLIGRRDVHLREKTLWRMLYETCARTGFDRENGNRLVSNSGIGWAARGRFLIAKFDTTRTVCRSGGAGLVERNVRCRLKRPPVVGRGQGGVGYVA
ncbi:hypothetical protein [Nocardia testacea]|uniref:Core-binding (CB) domain-containing protein n=1 Tax=Nocardia testacea TaxID=248551 RepID=A0ABW7VXM8_9NOCA